MLKEIGRTKPWNLTMVLACALASAWLLPRIAGAAEPEATYSWQRTDTSIALLHHGRVVWKHHHDKAVGKPHMKVCLVDGTELTRPWPMPEGYEGYDHPWHKGMWWSWKVINGVNFWAKNPKGTELVKVGITVGDDHSARVDVDIHYRMPQAEPVLTEKRRIEIGAPDDQRRYHIDWTVTFTATDKDVTLNKGSYGGMSARMAKRTSPWTFRDSEGREGEEACSRKRARWIDFSGTLADSKEAGMAIFVHPDNPGQPPTWCVIQKMPYFNPVFAGGDDYTLAAGKTLTLRYRMLVHPGLMTRQQVEAAWKAFSEATPEQ